MHPSGYEKLTVAQAIAYQHELRRQLQIVPLNKPVHTVGGADISFNKFSEIIYAGIVVLSYPELKKIDEATVISRTSFPYISGLLAFREVPALLEALKKLSLVPDVMILDGQGIAHRRRTGIATHFGLLTDIPSIGCAKSRLWGDMKEPENIPFAQTEITDDQEVVGIALRTKRNCKPVLISPGHRVSMQQSADIIKTCTGRHRIPEPTRLAHLLVNEVRLYSMANSGGQQTLF